MIPETQYVRTAGISIAYQVIGEGPVDLVLVPGFLSNIEVFWEQPRVARFLHKLASFSRLIVFDKRGTGLSDRVTDAATLEERIDDMRAVLDKIGSERTALLGYSEGGSMCALFAATYPERTVALIMVGSFARRTFRDDYRCAPTDQEMRQSIDDMLTHWGEPVGLDQRGPSVAQDPAMVCAIFADEREPGRGARVGNRQPGYRYPPSIAVDQDAYLDSSCQRRAADFPRCRKIPRSEHTGSTVRRNPLNR